jgi:ankyrin repeat protein
MSAKYDKYADQARKGNLPIDFDQWGSAKNDGWTVAHVAAGEGGLPSDFDQWDLANKLGETVAHVAAENGNLPLDFDRWMLANRIGWTVAHSMTRHNKYIDFLNRAGAWSAANKNGWTVAHSAAVSGHLPADISQSDIIFFYDTKYKFR